MELFNYSKMRFNSLQQYLEYLSGSLRDLNELEQIRFIYLSLLSNDLGFDLEYAFGDEQARQDVYNRCNYSDDAFNLLFRNKKIICKSISYLFEYICCYFGHDVETITAEEKDKICPHVYNGVTLKNGTKFTVDLQRDLANVQAHEKTDSFGLDYEQRESIINDEVLEKIDYKINYINDDAYYTDRYLYFLRKAIQTSASLEEKMMLLLNNLDVYYDTSAMQYSGKRRYYGNLILDFLTVDEYLRTDIFDCYWEENNHKEFFMCVIISDEDSNITIFVFDNVTRRFVKIEDTILKERILKEMDRDFNILSKVKRIGKINL